MSSDVRNLTDIRNKLLSRRQELQDRRERADADLAHRREPLLPDFSEQAIQLQNDEALAAIGNAAGQELSAIDAALDRIAAGQYGDCCACGASIDPTRLEAIPHAILCGNCADIRARCDSAGMTRSTSNIHEGAGHGSNS